MQSRTSVNIFISILIGILLATIIAEIIARLAGFEPYKEETYEVQLQPEGKLFQKDELLGFQIKPGKYHLTLPSGFEFTITHDEESNRISRPVDGWIEEDFDKQIWIFGCSYTHGWSVNDHETYAWLLQEKLPTVEFTNFAQPAYSTVHTLLQLKQALRNHSPPNLVVLAYASFHNERNVSSRLWHRTLAPFNQLGQLDHPFARMHEDSLIIEYAVLDYEPYPLSRRSGLVHMIEQHNMQRELKSLNAEQTTIKLIEEIYSHCLSHGIDFLLTTIVSDETSDRVLAHCRGRGMETFDITVDTRIPENTNLPHDSHPSAKAHREYSEKLGQFISSSVDKGSNR